MRRRSLSIALALLACLPCTAREYRIVEAADEAFYERELNASADAGYHFVAAAIGRSADGRERLLALMARDGASEREPGRFRVLTTTGNLDLRALEPINALAQRSFAVDDVLVRPLPDWWITNESYGRQLIWILSKRPTGTARGYELRTLSVAKRLEEQLAEQSLAVGRLLASGRRVHAVLGEEDVDRSDGAAPYRVLVEARRHALRRALTQASREGYEIVDAAASAVNAPPVLLLKRREGVRPLSYKFVARPLKLQRRGRLTETLTRLGNEGFELLPPTLLDTDWIATRPAAAANATSRPRYRLLTSREGDLAQRASDATEDGFEFVALLTAPAEVMILMLRRDDASD